MPHAPSTFILCLFSLICLIVLCLPLYPALRQYRTKHQQLTLSYPSAGPDWLAEARQFQQRIDQEFATLRALTSRDGSLRGASENGESFLILGVNTHLRTHIPPNEDNLNKLIVAEGALKIPGKMNCQKPLFAGGNLSLERQSQIDAALVLGEGKLASKVRVRQWLHCQGALQIKHHALLTGCISSTQTLTLDIESRFERLYAPNIRIGIRENFRHLPAAVQRVQLPPPSNARLLGDGRWLIDGDLHVPPGHIVYAKLVVNGDLLLGSGSQISDDVQVKGQIIAHIDAAFGGAIFADQHVSLASGCRVAGPLEISGNLSAGAQTVFGTPQQFTTLIADTIHLVEGCLIHGGVWARRRGYIEADAALEDL